MIIDAIGWTLVGLGVVVSLIGSIGLHRFADTYARMHVAGSITTLGTVPVLFGSALVIGGGGAAKLILAGVFLLVTTPAATQKLAAGALESGTGLEPDTHVAELLDAGPGHPITAEDGLPLKE
ncbi:monovalent cation/H(+) antiporter subunit G [Euzebya tangerina]|uniref:monovalent cation/H(+) antiporter subunit G n=1 Tax=Euzebya tangerina TaxID=591198 RepID=UPI000E31B685|nr:monovalent cation/H(+) antiporter subunit G [Euzebya tangerina]